MPDGNLSGLGQALFGRDAMGRLKEDAITAQVAEAVAAQVRNLKPGESISVTRNDTDVDHPVGLFTVTVQKIEPGGDLPKT